MIRPPSPPRPRSWICRWAKSWISRRPIWVENITFAIGLNNAGPDTATNVAVLDRLPAGVSYVSSSPSQGTFDPTSGRWTVGTVPKGTNVTLRIVAKVTQLGPQVNTTEIVAVDQYDTDSTPGNNKARRRRPGQRHRRRPRPPTCR